MKTKLNRNACQINGKAFISERSERNELNGIIEIVECISVQMLSHIQFI